MCSTVPYLLSTLDAFRVDKQQQPRTMPQAVPTTRAETIHHHP
jgi:hypothetical protein